MTTPVRTWPRLLAALLAREDLTADDTRCAPTDLWTPAGEGIRRTAFDVARFGIGRARPGDLAGGDAADNAKVVRSVAEGEPGATLDAVLVNAAGALAAGSGAASAGDFEDAFASGLDQARTAVSSGAAARLLDQWISLAVELADPR